MKLSTHHSPLRLNSFTKWLRALVCLIAILQTSLCAAAEIAYQWKTLAGLPGGAGNTDGARTIARFGNLSGLAVDAAGDVYVVDGGNFTIRKISATGVVSTIAGSSGQSGTIDGTGTAARFSSSVSRIAVDKNGNLYVTDNQTVRKITPGGIVTTLAGIPGLRGSSNGTSSNARFRDPEGLAVDASGTIYVADTGNSTIRRITPAGDTSLYAGFPGSTGVANGPALFGATFYHPMSVSLDSSGNVFVGDTFNHRIRQITTLGTVSTLAGDSTQFNDIWDSTIDASGNIYAADGNNRRVRKISKSGFINTFATGIFAWRVAATPSGTVYATESSSIVYKITSAGAVSVYAGSVSYKGSTNGTGTAARFSAPEGVAIDANGNVFVADTANHTIRKVTAMGVATTIAGVAGSLGSTDGAAATARFRSPTGLAINGSGLIFVADRANHAIRMINAAGTVSTFAGTAGSSGTTNASGASARFTNPSALALAADDSLFIADEGNHLIRRITSDGTASTFAGTVSTSGSADGIGTAATFRSPRGIVVNKVTGVVFVADTGNHTIRQIASDGSVTTLAGSAGSTGSTDGTGSAARFNRPTALTLDADGNLYVTDSNNHTIRKVTLAGEVTTIGGSPGVASHQDGTGSAAIFALPSGIAASPAGNLYVADTSNNRIASGIQLVPRLIVEQPASTQLTNMTSTIDFGSAPAQSSKTLVFTLRNNGLTTLSNLAVSLTGSAASDYAVTSLAATSVAVGKTTTLTITFKPSLTGTRIASLVITSNDPHNNPFTIQLTGTGTPGVAFQNSLALVNEEAGSINVPIIRTGDSSGAVSVRVRSTIGTASAADFGAFSNLLVEFADGEVSKNVSVPITLDALAEANEAFTLTLSDPLGGIALSTPATTTVRIVDTIDTTKPAVVISTPASGAGVAESPVVNVTGSASDNKGVLKVQVALNGGSYVDATTTIAATGATATFIAPVSPVAGLNTITAKSIDTRNNESLIVTRTFYYHVPRPLTVVIDGTGTVPLPIAAATYNVNFPYTITAKPGVGQVFDGWTVNDTTGTNITAAMMELPTLTFTHREGLTLTAHFKSNPFTSAIIGTFTGLVLPSTIAPAPSGTLASNGTVGWISANVLSTGAFTGTLKIDGLTLPMSGIFDNEGDARFGTARSKTLSLARTTKPALEVSLKLDMTGTISKLTGTVTQRYRTTITAVSDIDADRAAYLLTKNAPPSLAGTTSKPYTLVFKHLTSQPGLLAIDYPQGDGFATGTIKTNGTVSISGKLADHTAITAAAHLSKMNRWPLFAQLYALKGSFNAWINVDDAPADTDMTGSSVHWFRPYQATQWYPWGWDEGIDVDIIGAHYSPPPAGVFPVPLPVDALNGNATLTFSDGGLSPSVVKAVNISPTNVANRAPTSDTSYTFTLTPTSGLISGTYFTHTNLTKPAWQGVLFQKGANKAGYGYFMTASPKVVDGTGQSGAVKLLAR